MLIFDSLSIIKHTLPEFGNQKLVPKIKHNQHPTMALYYKMQAKMLYKRQWNMILLYIWKKKLLAI